MRLLRSFILRLSLTATGIILCSCGDSKLSPNEELSQASFKKQIEEARLAAAPATANLPAGTQGQTASGEADAPVQGEEIAVLTEPPNVPPPITRKHPTKVIINLEVKEVVKRLADGVNYTFWTFGGCVPGKFIRIRQNDEVEFHLLNHPTSKMPHNIDLHAVTGPGGGAAGSFTAPGHESVFSFKAINAGLYVYHCATAPVGMHVANGMYGLILVEPKEGMPHADKEFYVMQSEFYTKGKYGEGGLQPFDMEKALNEQPDYVVFNGSVGAMAGASSGQAKVGDTVRLFVGVGGPNLTSSFHVIGEIFDHVYAEGGTIVNRNVQTTMIPAGGSAIVDFKCEVPGNYILVDHSLFRAFNKGAVAMINVTGDENKVVFSGKIDDRIYLAEEDTIQTMPGALVPPNPAQTEEERPSGMVVIPGGSFPPLFGFVRSVNPFHLDALPVTNEDFLEFVRAQPEWRRSKAKRVFCETGYLRHWLADLEPGPKAPLDAPVTHVSWFAARAYLRTQGKRLPTTDEWEFAARASSTEADASRNAAFTRMILDWYAKPTPDPLPSVHSAQANVFGARGLHGLAWEWVTDFNNVISIGEGRSGYSNDRDFFCGAGAMASADPSNYAAVMRYAFRSSLKGNYCVANLTFRGARSP